MHKEGDDELRRNVVLALLENDTFITEVLRLVDSDPVTFRQNMRDSILRAFELELPKDVKKVQAIFRVIDLVVRIKLPTPEIKTAQVNIIPRNDITEVLFRVTGDYLIKNFEIKNLDEFSAIVEQAALNIDFPAQNTGDNAEQNTYDTPPPTMEPPPPPPLAQYHKKPVPRPPMANPTTSTANKIPPLPPRRVKNPVLESTPSAPVTESTMSVRPPPPSHAPPAPYAPKFTKWRDELITQIKQVDAKYQQFSLEGGADLAKKYLNASNALVESKRLNALNKKLGLDEVKSIVESMVTEALKGKKPLDVRFVQVDIEEAVKLLQAASDRIHGQLNCSDAAHSVIDKLIVNLKVQSEVMQNKAQKPDLKSRFLHQKREEPGSGKDDGNETPQKRRSGSNP